MFVISSVKRGDTLSGERLTLEHNCQGQGTRKTWETFEPRVLLHTTLQKIRFGELLLISALLSSLEKATGKKSWLCGQGVKYGSLPDSDLGQVPNHRGTQLPNLYNEGRLIPMFNSG